MRGCQATPNRGAKSCFFGWRNGKLTYYPELTELIILRLLQDRQGTIWAGAYGVPAGRLCAVQKDNARCYGEDGHLGPGVISLLEDSKGNLWVGVQKGIWRWKPGLPKFYPFPGEPNGILGLTEDADGALLVGWKGGIYKFMDGKTELYSLPGTKREFRTSSLFRDRDGSLWIATKDHGLVLFTGIGQMFMHRRMGSQAIGLTFSLKTVKGAFG